MPQIATVTSAAVDRRSPISTAAGQSKTPRPSAAVAGPHGLEGQQSVPEELDFFRYPR